MVCLIFLFGENGLAQTGIAGKISDKESGEDMISADIIISQNGVFIQGETMDIDGNYSIQMDSEEYDMEVSYTGYTTQKITGIVVIEGIVTKVDVQISMGEIIDICLVVVGMTIRLISPWDMLRGMKLTEEKIQYLPTRDIFEMTTLAPGITFSN